MNRSSSSTAVSGSQSGAKQTPVEDIVIGQVGDLADTETRPPDRLAGAGSRECRSARDGRPPGRGQGEWPRERAARQRGAMPSELDLACPQAGLRRQAMVVGMASAVKASSMRSLARPTWARSIPVPAELAGGAGPGAGIPHPPDRYGLRPVLVSAAFQTTSGSAWRSQMSRPGPASRTSQSDGCRRDLERWPPSPGGVRYRIGELVRLFHQLHGLRRDDRCSRNRTSRSIARHPHMHRE